MIRFCRSDVIFLKKGSRFTIKEYCFLIYIFVEVFIYFVIFYRIYNLKLSLFKVYIKINLVVRKY